MNARPMPWPQLAFDAPEEEALFAAQAFQRWLRQSTYGGLVALLFNNAFLTLDWMIGPEVFQAGLWIRFWLCTSVGLVVVVSGFVCLWRPVPWLRQRQEALVVMASALAGLSILLVATCSPLHGTLWGIFYHAGLVPVLAFGAVVLRLRFRAVCALAVALLLMHWGALALTPPVPGAPVGSIMLTVFMPFLFMLVFSYRLERASRHRFEQKRRAAGLRDQLQAQRAALENAAQRDPLTGAMNRRGFQAYMAQMLERVNEPDADMAYAMALIDIDHFKRFNDGHGHPAGDECLCAVAQALMAQADKRQGLLARWGGEEFVLAWPLHQPQDLVASGQALCQAVADMALPHAHSPTGPVVTISVGVASAEQFPPGTDWSIVLAHADVGLYQAKHEGRHRACMAPSPAGLP